MIWYKSIKTRMSKDIQRIPLVHELNLNNGKWVILPIWWWHDDMTQHKRQPMLYSLQHACKASNNGIHDFKYSSGSSINVWRLLYTRSLMTSSGFLAWKKLVSVSKFVSCCRMKVFMIHMHLYIFMKAKPRFWLANNDIFRVIGFLIRAFLSNYEFKMYPNFCST